MKEVKTSYAAWHLVNTSEASTRLRLAFPSKSILVLTDIPLRTRWSRDIKLFWSRGIKLCEGKKQRKRQEMPLGTCQPRGLNAYFQFIWSSRAGAQRNFQILNQLLASVALSINEHSTDEGHSPETSGHLLRFWHFQQHFQLLFP